MTKLSKDHADVVKDQGPVLEHTTTVDGYTMSEVMFRDTVDLAQILTDLPGGHCACPHWGYVIKGRVTVRYADHEEVLEAGDTYYMAPGHVPVAEAGTVLSMISPADDLLATEAAIDAAMQAG